MQLLKRHLGRREALDEPSSRRFLEDVLERFPAALLEEGKTIYWQRGKRKRADNPFEAEDLLKGEFHHSLLLYEGFSLARDYRTHSHDDRTDHDLWLRLWHHGAPTTTAHLTYSTFRDPAFSLGKRSDGAPDLYGVLLLLSELDPSSEADARIRDWHVADALMRNAPFARYAAKMRGAPESVARLLEEDLCGFADERLVTDVRYQHWLRAKGGVVEERHGISLPLPEDDPEGLLAREVWLSYERPVRDGSIYSFLYKAIDRSLSGGDEPLRGVEESLRDDDQLGLRRQLRRLRGQE
ncbi:hypothetical protein JXA12_04915 [Candidatus Woesearchaeota archaeon]|nr:hypothetical protein [Candidatus Woesearchaeota archaeon]